MISKPVEIGESLKSFNIISVMRSALWSSLLLSILLTSLSMISGPTEGIFFSNSFQSTWASEERYLFRRRFAVSIRISCLGSIKLLEFIGVSDLALRSSVVYPEFNLSQRNINLRDRALFMLSNPLELILCHMQKLYPSV